MCVYVYSAGYSINKFNPCVMSTSCFRKSHDEMRQQQQVQARQDHEQGFLKKLTLHASTDEYTATV